MIQGATMGEVVLETGQECREEGAVAGVSVESVEPEAKTQDNPHPHPTRRLWRTKGLRETSLR